jgi:hypothetical protein
MMCEDSMSTIQRRMHLQSAIIRFMIKRCWSSYNAWKEWDAELRSVSSFQICTDHKNLKYFMTVD